MFSNFKVRYRILFGSAVPLLLFVIVALIVASFCVLGVGVVQ